MERQHDQQEHYNLDQYQNQEVYTGQHLEEHLQKRERLLRNLQELDTASMEQLIQELRVEHQHLVFMETNSVDGAERGYYRQLMMQNEDQASLIQKRIDKMYQLYAKQATPKAPLMKNIWRAFLVGGLICAFGQLIINGVMLQYQVDFKTAAPMASIVIVVIVALLTGVGVYDEIGRYGGAGSMVPISGFANSVVSAALEFKREGMIYGIGAKIFQIAGPVILYGTLASVIIGLIYYVMG